MTLVYQARVIFLFQLQMFYYLILYIQMYLCKYFSCYFNRSGRRSFVRSIDCSNSH